MTQVVRISRLEEVHPSDPFRFIIHASIDVAEIFRFTRLLADNSIYYIMKPMDHATGIFRIMEIILIKANAFCRILRKR